MVYHNLQAMNENPPPRVAVYVYFRILVVTAIRHILREQQQQIVGTGVGYLMNVL
jgi:hypothetical protein